VLVSKLYALSTSQDFNSKHITRPAKAPVLFFSDDRTSTGVNAILQKDKRSRLII